MKLIAITFFISCQLLEGRALCGTDNSVNGVKFNVPERLLSKEVFDSVIDNVQYGQIYLLIPIPPPFTPSDNYYCIVTKVDDTTYSHTCTMNAANSTCRGYTVPLNLVTGNGNGGMSLNGNESAVFTFQFQGDPTVYTVAHWSSYPDKYYWKMECIDFNGTTDCLPGKTLLAIFLREGMSLDEAPLNEIVKDLEWTGVHFGSIPGLKWYFTNYEEMPCQD